MTPRKDLVEHSAPFLPEGSDIQQVFICQAAPSFVYFVLTYLTGLTMHSDQVPLRGGYPGRHLRTRKQQAVGRCKATVSGRHDATPHPARAGVRAVGSDRYPRRAPLGAQALPPRHRRRRSCGWFHVGAGIFWAATMMVPRWETRRWTATGRPLAAGRGRRERAPRSLCRLAAGTGQGIVRSRFPARSRTAIWVPSRRRVIRCPANWYPTLTWAPARLASPAALMVRSTSMAVPLPAGSGGSQAGQLGDPQPRGQGLDAGALEQHVQDRLAGPDGDRARPGRGRARSAGRRSRGSPMAARRGRLPPQGRCHAVRPGRAAGPQPPARPPLVTGLAARAARPAGRGLAGPPRGGHRSCRRGAAGLLCRPPPRVTLAATTWRCYLCRTS